MVWLCSEQCGEQFFCVCGQVTNQMWFGCVQSSVVSSSLVYVHKQPSKCGLVVFRAVW